MALGKKLFIWDAKDMIRGMSTSDDLADGGFSSTTDAVQLTNTPGVMYSPASPTDKSTGLTGEIIASCEDPAASAARLYVSTDSDQDGRFYSIDSTGTLTARGSEDTGGNYISGSCDMIPYKGEVYVTNSVYIVRWVQPATFTTNFMPFNDTSAPHPAIVFEDNAYYADGNELHRQTAAGSAPNPAAAILTLPSSYVITALGIDPGTGRMLIATVDQYNISDTQATQARVHYYDGFSNKVLKTVPVDSMVTAFPFTEGQLYAAMGTTLGYWNGAGVTFLRKFSVNADNAQLLYKHRFTGIKETLYFVERTKIIAHGPIQQGGSKVFYPAFKNQVNSNVFSNIAFIGSGATNTGQFLSMAFATAKFYTWDSTSVATSNSQDFYSNDYEFDDEVWIRRIRIIYKNKVSNGTDPGSLRLYDQDGAVTSLAQSGLFDLSNTSGAASAFKDLLNVNYKAKQIQFELLLDTVNPGVRRVIFYGDLANLP